MARKGAIKWNVFVKPNEQTRARSRSAMARKCAIKWNVFVKPNEQNKARFNSAMARKRRRNPTFSLSQMSRIKLALILSWREKVP